MEWHFVRFPFQIFLNSAFRNYTGMRTTYFFLFLFVTIACSSDPAQKQRDIFAKRNPKGTIIQNIMCKADMQQTYVLYLPKEYNSEKKYPVVFCFDPHGAGALPVNLLKDDAEKLGIVLVGFNTLQNGLSQDEVYQRLSTLMQDVPTKVSIDDKRIYMAGFSGGARVALSALMNNPNIRGVIACSGSIPASYIPKQAYLAGIAGTDDMNYAEMIQMENGFSPEADRHILFTFSGKHGWPPIATIRAALQWLSISEMKDKLIPLNKDIVEQFIHSQYTDTLSLSEKYRGCRQIVRTLEGLTDVSNYQQKIKSLEADPNLQLELAKEARLDSIEKDQQKIYMDAFNGKSIGWWKEEIARLNKNTKLTGSKMETALNKRLLAYISLYAYSAANYARKSGDMQVLSKYLEIYGMVDPENPDYFYFLAGYYAATGKKDQTIKALGNAIYFGIEVNKIMGDAAFTNLIGVEALQELVKTQKVK